jgi:hypothetical protein
MNAWLLRIDLAAMVLSPLKAGLLMEMVSVSAGCLFIAIWTVCSWGVEFWLLGVVFHSVPALAVKRSPDVALGMSFLNAVMCISDKGIKTRYSVSARQVWSTNFACEHSDS